MQKLTLELRRQTRQNGFQIFLFYNYWNHKGAFGGIYVDFYCKIK